MLLPPPCPLLFPYTTLFRSDHPRPSGELLRRGHPATPFRPRSSTRSTLWTPCTTSSPASTSTVAASAASGALDRKSTRLNSSHLVISYAVFCLKKKKKRHTT